MPLVGEWGAALRGVLARTFVRSAWLAQSVGTGLGNGADALRAVDLLDALAGLLAMAAVAMVEELVVDIPGSLGFSPVVSSAVVLGIAGAAVVVADGAIKMKGRERCERCERG